jgi:hypothetical protein
MDERMRADRAMIVVCGGSGWRQGTVGIMRETAFGEGGLRDIETCFPDVDVAKRHHEEGGRDGDQLLVVGSEIQDLYVRCELEQIVGKI